MKGIILAGGSGKRLYPITMVTSKQLLPVYDKPMIYYPLSTLMLSGIKDIAIITTPSDINNFKHLLGDGNSFGIKLTYLVQSRPEGLAQAFLIAKDFIGNDSCAMILGDNIFYGGGLTSFLDKASENAINGIATIFGYYVEDPNRFGIVEFDDELKVISVEEKPLKPKSNYCITGLYFYPSGVSQYAKNVKPSARGELEITSLNSIYLDKNKLNVQILGRGFAWIDTGTTDSLVEASNFVQIIEKRQGVKISVPEEIAYRKNWISKVELESSVNRYGASNYSEYLKKVLEGKIKY